jgi:branched-chain amino acid transport system substrate-binding protein
MIKSRMKLVCPLLMVVLVLALVISGCGGNSSAGTTTTAAPASTTASTAGTTTSATEGTTASTAGTTTSVASTSSSVAVAVTEWHIPVALPMTGAFAGQAVSAKWVAEQGAADINKGGGIAGKQVVLDFYDSGFDPAKAATIMGKIVDSGALASVGPWFEPEAAGAMPVAQRAGMVEVAQGGEDTFRQYVPWNVWLNFQREDLTHVVDMWNKQVPDMKASCAIGIGSMASVVTMMKIMQDELVTKNVASKGIVDVPMDTVDFATPVAKAMATGADTFILMFTSDGGAKICAELVKRGVDPHKIFISDGMVDSTFLKLSAGYNEGAYSNESLTYPYTDKWTQLNKDYAASHEGNFINVRWYEFYDALYLIKAAIEAKGITGDPAKLKDERTAIKDYLTNVAKFAGAKHTYSIVNSVARVPIYLFQIKSNEFTYVDKWEPQQ